MYNFEYQNPVKIIFVAGLNSLMLVVLNELQTFLGQLLL